MSATFVVYKARFRPRPDPDYDVLHPPLGADERTRYVIFEDVPEPGCRDGWEVLPQAFSDLDCVRRARHHKCLAHVLFPDAEATLWLDGVYQPLVSVAELVERYLGEHSDFAAHPHPTRNCLYMEARKLALNGKADERVLGIQTRRYADAGFPRGNGLHATGALLRRNSAAVAMANELWWSEVANGSARDQVSFDFCVWKYQLKASHFPGYKHTCALWRWRRHRPRVAV